MPLATTRRQRRDARPPGELVWPRLPSPPYGEPPGAQASGGLPGRGESTMGVCAWSVVLAETGVTARPLQRAPDGLATRQRKGCDAAGSSRCNGFQSPPWERPPSAQALGVSPDFMDSASERRGGQVLLRRQQTVGDRERDARGSRLPRSGQVGTTEEPQATVPANLDETFPEGSDANQ